MHAFDEMWDEARRKEEISALQYKIRNQRLSWRSLLPALFLAVAGAVAGHFHITPLFLLLMCTSVQFFVSIPAVFAIRRRMLEKRLEALQAVERELDREWNNDKHGIFGG